MIFSETELAEDEMKDKIRRLGLGERFPFLVAEDEGKVVGYAYAHLWMPDPVYDRSWEVTIYFSPDASGKGMGTEILSRLVEECRAAGAHTLISCITEGNTPCESLHRKLGFTLRGVYPEVGYKFGKYYNDAVYQLLF